MKKLKKNKNLDFEIMYLIFVIGCFIGVIYEDIIGIVKYYHIYNVWHFETRRGLIYGPFNPLYGGAIVIIILLLRKVKNKPKVFIYGALLGGFIEYIVNFLMEIVLHINSWDYHDRFLNINGRTTIPYMLFWGLAVLILVEYLYPLIVKLIKKIPDKIRTWLVIFFIVFMLFDMSITFIALARSTLRHMGYEPISFIGKYFDKNYSDEVLKKSFVNMKFTD